MNGTQFRQSLARMAPALSAKKVRPIASPSQQPVLRSSQSEGGSLSKRRPGYQRQQSGRKPSTLFLHRSYQQRLQRPPAPPLPASVCPRIHDTLLKRV